MLVTDQVVGFHGFLPTEQWGPKYSQMKQVGLGRREIRQPEMGEGDGQ